VHPTVEGEPAPGYIVDEMQVQPKSVEVVGPESALRRVTEAITEPVWVGNATASVKSTVAVAVAESGVRLKTPRLAQVQVQVVPAPAERQLNVPVRMRGLMPGLNAVITPPLVRVRVRGTTAALNRLRDSAVVAFVDLDGIAEGDYGLPVRVEKIPGVGIDQPDPPTVGIHVE
jgi:YbbR domain-containing protein